MTVIVVHCCNGNIKLEFIQTHSATKWRRTIVTPQKNKKYLFIILALIFLIASGVIIYILFIHANNISNNVLVDGRQRIIDKWIIIAFMSIIGATALFGIVLYGVEHKGRLSLRELPDNEGSNSVEESETDGYTQLLFDVAPLSCTLWDTDLRIINCNKEALKLFGMETVGEFNDNFYNLMPRRQPCGESSIELAKATILKAFDEGFVRVDWMHQFMSGDPLPTEVTLIRVNGKNGYLVAGYTRDLREHNAYINEINKARDAAETSNRAKSVFLANINHEIRTPMNNIIGLAELALSGENPAKSREYLEKINENSKWLLYIVNDILDISKIESGYFGLEHIPFSLVDVFAQCQMLIRPKAIEKGLALHCHSEPALRKMLLGDPVRLKQALINILTNAVKFTHEGFVEFSAGIVSLNENNAVVHFEIKDSGIGIGAKQIEMVFQPFVQADVSIARKYGGTGLGLSITKSIVEMMGGKLEVESKPGVGSKFSFNLTFDVFIEPEGPSDKKTAQRDMAKPDSIGETPINKDSDMDEQGLIHTEQGQSKYREVDYALLERLKAMLTT